jgi:hypothetical protein
MRSKGPKQTQAERIIPDHHCWAQPDTQTTVSGGRRCAFPPYACLPEGCPEHARIAHRPDVPVIRLRNNQEVTAFLASLAK